MDCICRRMYPDSMWSFHSFCGNLLIRDQMIIFSPAGRLAGAEIPALPSMSKKKLWVQVPAFAGMTAGVTGCGVRLREFRCPSQSARRG